MRRFFLYLISPADDPAVEHRPGSVNVRPPGTFFCLKSKYLEEIPCRRKLPNITEKRQNILPMQPTTMAKPPSITTPAIMKRLHTMLTPRGAK
jgi:hypothetical protein